MALDLSSSHTPPPAKPQARKPRAKAVPKETDTARIERRTDGLIGLASIATIPLALTGNIADIAACNDHVPNIATEAANAAETDERIAGVIDKAIAIGPYAKLLGAIVPLALQIAVNHKRLPFEPLAKFGVKSPELLTAQIQAQAAAQHREAMRARAEAEAEIAKLQQEMATG